MARTVLVSIGVISWHKETGPLVKVKVHSDWKRETLVAWPLLRVSTFLEGGSAKCPRGAGLLQSPRTECTSA